MKALYATILVFFLVATCAPDAEAQRRLPWQHQISVDGGIQFPYGDIGDNLDDGYGGALTYYYRASRNLFVSLSGGYYAFDFQNRDESLNVIPVLGGFKFNFKLTGIQPYLGAEGGVFVFDRTADNAETETNLGVVPKFGLRFPLLEGLDFDVNVRYNAVFSDPSFTYLGINGGLALVLN